MLFLFVLICLVLDDVNVCLVRDLSDYVVAHVFLMSVIAVLSFAFFIDRK